MSVALTIVYGKQEDPIAEWFGGYSYSRINPDFLAEGANSHGFHVDVVLNTRLLGFVTDLSKQYGESAGTQLSTTTFLFGSRFARRVKNITWFVQSLYGSPQSTRTATSLVPR